MKDFMTGAELLAQFKCETREQKLEQAVKALMQQLDELHSQVHEQNLSYEIENKEVFCSCADAYRMGHEALKD